MKKTTKFLLVLAAVVAMTIGAVSTVMAADVVVDAATWSEDDNGNYSAKDTNGNKIKTGWAVDAAGRWYYFEDGIALKNEFLRWRGNYYYFGQDCIMCEGWVEFTNKNDDPIVNLDPDTSDAISGLLDKDSGTAYAKSVWCYFEKGGIAAMDKWVEDNGLWYYFDDVIMVCNDYDYTIDKKIYGFSGDGNMHVGWIPVNSTKKSGGGPTAASKTNLVGYVYYKTNGEMVKEGWNKIDGDWYYFVNNTEDSRFNTNGVAVNTPVMLSNMYINVNGERFWLTASGAMATGTVTLSKKYEYYKDVEAFLAGNKVKANADTVTVLQFGDNGAQVLGGKVDKSNNYYLNGDETNFYTITELADGYNKNSSEIYFLNNIVPLNDANNDKVATGSAISAGVVGDKVKNAFRVEGDKIYYYDADGNMVKNDVVDFYGVTVAFDSKGVLITESFDDDGEHVKKKVNGTYFYFDESYGALYIGDADEPAALGCSTKKPN